MSLILFILSHTFFNLHLLIFVLKVEGDLEEGELGEGEQQAGEQQAGEQKDKGGRQAGVGRKRPIEAEAVYLPPLCNNYLFIRNYQRGSKTTPPSLHISAKAQRLMFVIFWKNIGF